MSYMHHAWTGEHQPGGVSLPGALVTSVRFGAQEYLATPTLRSARNSCNSDGSDRWTASGDQRCHAVCETAHDWKRPSKSQTHGAPRQGIAGQVREHALQRAVSGGESDQPTRRSSADILPARPALS